MQVEDDDDVVIVEDENATMIDVDNSVGDQLAMQEVSEEVVASAVTTRWGGWGGWMRGWYGWIGSWVPRWRPTSAELLHAAEMKMLQGIRGKYEQGMVMVDGVPINTLKIGQGPPLVLVHGFGAALGHWARNLDTLAQYHTVYAIDLIGFGRSGRPYFKPKNAEEAEEFFIESLEGWRKQVGLEKFNLLGHSFGGYVTALYAMKYPDTVDHLILADPWGVPGRQEHRERRISWKWRMVAKFLMYFNPLASVRFAGPYGPALIHRFRPDLPKKWIGWHEEEAVDGEEEEEEEEEAQEEAEEQAAEAVAKAVAEKGKQLQQLQNRKPAKVIPPVVEYIYHSNAQYPATGETAFNTLTVPIGWAANPLCDRLHELDPEIPVTFLYGQYSWMDRTAAVPLMEKMENETRLHVIPDAGHHIYLDNSHEFHFRVLQATSSSSTRRRIDHESRREGRGKRRGSDDA